MVTRDTQKNSRNAFNQGNQGGLAVEYRDDQGIVRFFRHLYALIVSRACRFVIFHFIDRIDYNITVFLKNIETEYYRSDPFGGFGVVIMFFM